MRPIAIGAVRPVRSDIARVTIMPHKPIETEFEIDGKPVAIAIDAPETDTLPNCCFVLGHGASGNFTTGNLPTIAARLSALGCTVLRYTTTGSLAKRIRILKVSFCLRQRWYALRHFVEQTTQYRKAFAGDPCERE